ncbi:hypothetical protein HK405_010969, partial [Cladochytrium tenue]
HDRIPGSPTPAARRPAVTGGHNPAPAGARTNAGADHPAGSFGALLAAIDLQLDDSSPQPSTEPHDLGVAFASSANHNDAPPERSWIPYRAPTNARGTNRRRVVDDDDDNDEDMEGWWPAASARSAAATPRLRAQVPEVKPTAFPPASIGAQQPPVYGPGPVPARGRRSTSFAGGRGADKGDDDDDEEEDEQDDEGVRGSGGESDEEFVPGRSPKRVNKGTTERTARRQGGRGQKRRAGPGEKYKCSWVGCGKAFTTR